VFDWLFEGRTTVYVILGSLAVLCTAVWARGGFVFYREGKKSKQSSTTPQRKLARLPIALGVILLLAGGYFILDRLVETRNEQIARKLFEMARAVREQNADRIFQHISDQFRVQEMDRDAFRRSVETALRRGTVNDLVVWDVKFPDDTGRVSFQVKPKGSLFQHDEFFGIRAVFVLDNDGQWRLTSFEVFGPAGGAIPIPAMP
jgi:hypothetical protein